MDGGEVLHLHHHFIGGGVLQRGIQVGQLTAHHLGNDVLLGHIGHIPLANVLTVTHDGHFIRNDLDLVHLVADVHQCNALFLQLPHDAEQRLDLVRRQGGGGLVQDQHLTVGRDRLCDLHHLHLCDAQAAQLCPGVDIQLQLFQQSRRILVHFCMVHHRNGAILFGGVAPQPDILGHSTGRNRLQLLVHHRNAALQRVQRGGDVDLFALVFDLALIHLVNTKHAFHQGGLAGAVFAHQGHDLAGTKLQLCVVQRFYAGESLDHAFHYQTVFRHCSAEPPFY